jgi:hypothetical protein
MKNMNQRDLLVKELSRIEIIVNTEDHKLYMSFCAKHFQLKLLIKKLVKDEMSHMIYKKSPNV